MEIKEINHGHYVTLVPTGDLDANSSMLLDETIQHLIDQSMYNLHIDCTSLRYISSAGLGVFISFMDELYVKDGKFVFSGMTDNISKVFQLLGLEQLMVIVKTAADAEKAFQP
jgi:anti-sigma B factor antagonist